MKIRILSSWVLVSFVTGAGLAFASNDVPSNTGTPQTGMYTPGGRSPQVPQNSAPQAGSVGGQTPAAGAVDQNTGAGEVYFDEKTYTWKRKQ